MNECRNCGCRLPEQLFLQYNNMPKSAQFFPDENEIETEKGIDISLKQCLNCGLIQAAGDPVPYYRDVIRASGVSDEMRAFRNRQYSEWVHENQLAGKKIIEIGCGAGEYMNFMKTAGVQVYGLEHLKKSVEAACKGGLNVFEGFVENEYYGIPNAPYDGFYIMNFLEHIPQTGSFLRGICNNLSECSYGLVEVPNFDMMLKKSLYSEFIQDHLCYFTEETLRNVLENNGFEVLKCKSIWYDYIISAQVKKRSYTDISGFAEKHMQIKRQMKRFMEDQKSKGNNIAVWGAGHQALANLSLLEMSGYIKFVVDSADFKQNKYTPSTHIPISAPERLKNHEVQMVIIMAAGYSNEVASIMDREYPEIEKVILTEEGIEVCGK